MVLESHRSEDPQLPHRLLDVGSHCLDELECSQQEANEAADVVEHLHGLVVTTQSLLMIDQVNGEECRLLDCSQNRVHHS